MRITRTNYNNNANIISLSVIVARRLKFYERRAQKDIRNYTNHLADAAMKIILLGIYAFPLLV